MTNQDALIERIKKTIGPNMLLGLQDAELHDEPGEQRIREWVDWIAEAVAPLITEEVDAEVERIRAAVTEGKPLDRPRTASDVLVAHDVTRKALAEALDEGLHLNWPQLVSAARRSHAANAAWKADVDRVRALHTRGRTTGCCNDCGMVWPCTTTQALDNKEPATDHVTRRPPLITGHWFREGPVNPDGSDGYWICDYRGCGQHRGDHLQAERDWLKPLHTFVKMRVRPKHCKACGREWRHTTHTPWTWEQLAPITDPQPVKES